MTKLLSGFERQLCDIQGRLFELSLEKGLDSGDFIKKFMNSATCEYLDLPYDRLQWAGEEYVLENLLEEIFVSPAGLRFSREELYWTGYVYRYWHLLTGESSNEIFAQANATLMRECYLGFHTLDTVMAIEDLKTINQLQHTERRAG